MPAKFRNVTKNGNLLHCSIFIFLVTLQVSFDRDGGKTERQEREGDVVRTHGVREE